MQSHLCPSRFIFHAVQDIAVMFSWVLVFSKKFLKHPARHGTDPGFDNPSETAILPPRIVWYFAMKCLHVCHAPH